MAQDHTLFFKQSQALPFVVLRRADHSSACYHTHSHDEFSFGVIDNGEADYLNMKHKNHIGEGHTVTINPGDAHSCNPKCGRWSYRMLFVEAAWVGKLQQEMFDDYAVDYLPFTSLCNDDKQSYQLFSQLFVTLLTETNPLIVESLLIQFFELHFLSMTDQGKTTQKIDTIQIKQVKELIGDQLEKNISLDEFSDHCGLSRYHLIRSFKQMYGQSPHAFQLDQRIKKAKVLLQKGGSIVDIANTLGFADQSHFQRNFKKRLAMTPKQYQRFFSF